MGRDKRKLLLVPPARSPHGTRPSPTALPGSSKRSQCTRGPWAGEAERGLCSRPPLFPADSFCPKEPSRSSRSQTGFSVLGERETAGACRVQFPDQKTVIQESAASGGCSAQGLCAAGLRPVHPSPAALEGGANTPVFTTSNYEFSSHSFTFHLWLTKPPQHKQGRNCIRRKMKVEKKMS